MPGRFRSIVALVASLLLPCVPAATQAGAVIPALPAVALMPVPVTGFAFCSAHAATHADCVAGDPERGFAAVDELHALATRGTVDHVVLFVAGYATAFAAGETAAGFIQQVLGPRFLVVYVDWGSHGKHADYLQDARSARKASASFAELVSEIHASMPDRSLDIFSHSMGGRVVAGALALVPPQPDGKPVVDQAVLAAPDLSIADYKRAITRSPEPFNHIVIYQSSNDKALLLSEIINLHRRLGKLANVPVLPNTEVVDASAADRISDGHGYAVHDRRVILDIEAVFLDRPIPHPGWNEVERIHGINAQLAANQATTIWKLVPNLVTAP